MPKELCFDPPPDLGAIISAAFRDWHRIYHVERPLQRAIQRPALPAFIEMPLDFERVGLLAIVMQHQ